MSVRIIVDSTADLRQELLDQVTVLPLTVRFGEREYVDGVDIDARKFYTMLAESDVLPTTSQATPFAFAALFEEAVAAGDTVVCITIAQKLSGTCQSARIAAEDYPGKVFVVDSGSVTIGAGILVEYALELKDRGMTAEAIAKELEAARSRTRTFALVDTLEYLKKGGRISAAAAMAGGLLNIKPLIQIEDGVLNVVGKARGAKQALRALTELLEKAGGLDPQMPVLLGYTGNDDSLLRQYIAGCAEIWPEKEPGICVVGSVVGTHAGPGAIALAFFAGK